MATEKLYIDPTGKYQKGYVIDGKTYADPEGKTRVAVGSQTQADDGKWYQLTDTGGVAIPASQSYISQRQASQPVSSNDYISGISKALADSKIAALESAYNQNVSALNTQKADLPQTFADARNRTASQYETGRANFNQYAARTGLNSGAAGQAQLAMGTTYQGNLGALDTAEIKANRDIDTQIANLTSQYRAQVAQAQAEGDYERMQMLYKQYQNEQNVLRQEQQRQQEYDMTMSANKAELLASMGDFSGYQQLYGLDPQQTAALAATWKAQNTPTVKYTGGGGGGGGGSSTSAETGIIANMLALGDDVKAYEYLVGLGLAAGKTDTLYEFYKQQKAAQPQGVVGETTQTAKLNPDTLVASLKRGGGRNGLSAQAVENTLTQHLSSGQITQEDVAYILTQLGLM